MCPSLSGAMYKVQKPAVAALSLKQFMMRSEILKLYRGFLRLGKMLNEPPPDLPGQSGQPNNNGPVRDEWTRWVRAEFRLRVNSTTTDDEVTRTLLVHGKRQLQEMERTIMLATNRNTSSVRPPPSTPPTPSSHQCPSKNGREASNNSISSSQKNSGIPKSESGESR